ncbi:hypothetical protein [Streptomyces sp. NRRL B-1347]|uniref:hypothetical protein n=1 Tax=Streptomyces sp. NRRL B-1347 TaxID=1476877 RepID=UPI0004CC528D|nr:hypothetical protein [Streptomyces sp. NRRL B-1347]
MTSTPQTGTRRALPILTTEQIGVLKPELADVIEYRKSGLSLNWIVGCPLECGYCVRHLFDNFEMKTPRRLMSDAAHIAAWSGDRTAVPPLSVRPVTMPESDLPTGHGITKQDSRIVLAYM